MEMRKCVFVRYAEKAIYGVLEIASSGLNEFLTNEQNLIYWQAIKSIVGAKAS